MAETDFEYATDNDPDLREKRLVEKEVRAIQKVCGPGTHVNIVQGLNHGLLWNHPYYAIDMEICDVNLDDFIRRNVPPDPLKSLPDFIDGGSVDSMVQIWTIMSHVSNGVEYIHRTSKRNLPTKYSSGTPGYRAPELMDFGGDPAMYNKVDVWATGCILYELATGTRPFKSDWDVLNHRFSKRNMEVVLDDSFDTRSLVTITKNIVDMLQIDPSDRPSAAMLSKKFDQQLQLAHDRVLNTVVNSVTLLTITDNPKSTPPIPQEDQVTTSSITRVAVPDKTGLVPNKHKGIFGSTTRPGIDEKEQMNPKRTPSPFHHAKHPVESSGTNQLKRTHPEMRDTPLRAAERLPSDAPPPQPLPQPTPNMNSKTFSQYAPLPYPPPMIRPSTPELLKGSLTAFHEIFTTECTDSVYLEFRNTFTSEAYMYGRHIYPSFMDMVKSVRAMLGIVDYEVDQFLDIFPSLVEDCRQSVDAATKLSLQYSFVQSRLQRLENDVERLANTNKAEGSEKQQNLTAVSLTSLTDAIGELYEVVKSRGALVNAIAVRLDGVPRAGDINSEQLARIYVKMIQAASVKLLPAIETVLSRRPDYKTTIMAVLT